MDTSKQAENATKTIFFVLALLIKAIIGLFIFFFFRQKAKSAQKKLRSQYLLGELHDQAEQQNIDALQEKEGWYFALIFRFFHNLAPVWAALVSAFLTTLTINILNDIMFGLIMNSPATGAIINIGNFILFFYLIFSNKQKFSYYQNYQPGGGAGTMDASTLGTKDGKPTESFLNNVDPEKELILGQKTTIPISQRRTHMYVAGKIGSGKSKAAEYWFIQDALMGRGCALVDPHGDLAENVLESIAAHLYEKGVTLAQLDKDPLVKRIKIIDPTDTKFAVGYNPLELEEGIEPYMQAKQMEDTFKKVWKFDEAEAPVMSEVLRNMSYALIKNKLTLLEATALLTNKQLLEKLTEQIDNSEMRMFWQDRYTRWLSDIRNTKNESTLNKISSFAADTFIRPMLGQTKSTVNFRRAMDDSDIVIIKLAKGKLGSSANLLGAFFIASLHLAAIGREDIKTAKRVPFYVYVDEFQNFTSANFEEILREDRKYGLHYTLINQDLGSIDEETKHAIFGNVNTTVAFQIGDSHDAERIATRLFHLSGEMVRSYKHQEGAVPGIGLPAVSEEPDFHTIDAEHKLKAQELRQLPPRMFVVNYNGLSQAQVDVTVDTTLSVSEEILHEYVAKIREISNKRNAKLKTAVTKTIEERIHKLLTSVKNESERDL